MTDRITNEEGTPLDQWTDEELLTWVDREGAESPDRTDPDQEEAGVGILEEVLNEMRRRGIAPN